VPEQYSDVAFVDARDWLDRLIAGGEAQG
jgi:hypothetical protein